ncbi:BRISC and BRCA1-A complex member 1-like [Halichondria panicea]|uniref:BRISC and BRCA1-A complex member 1-like n=1 Tax=Halichondria panicea TaxID=6063 RepID=UPI00312B531E
MERHGSVSSILSHTSLQYEFNHLDIHANCPEKIILCIDLDAQVEATPVKSKDRGGVSMLTVWKNALELFVWNKHHLSKDHEFAVVILRDKAEWFCNFNSDPNEVVTVINQLEAVDEKYDSFDTASLYSIIHQNSCPPPPTDNPLLPPPYTVRAIMFYSRTNSMPIYQGDVVAHDQLMESPYFFLDILYSHEPPSPSNMCKGIFDILAELYPKPKALVLDWSYNVSQLFNNFSKLLAHPMQRPFQPHMDHKLIH